MDIVENKKLSLEETKGFIISSLQKIFDNPKIKTLDVVTYPIFPVNVTGWSEPRTDSNGVKVIIDIIFKDEE